MDDDLFGLSLPAIPVEEEEEHEAPDPSSTAFGSMLGGEDDDFQIAAPPSAVPPVSQPPSALVQWQRNKTLELAEQDAKDHAAGQALTEEAAARRDRFFANVKEASDNRARHNAELDAQRSAALDGHANPWVTVGELSAFDRTDLHVRDVSGMKKLLISLKTKPPSKD
jgi:hypothetical protein